MRLELVVIDPQNDFCATPGFLYPGHPGGSLYVPNAEKSIDRLATVVDRLAKKLSVIHVTLDSHRLVDVAHPIYWRDSNGNHPQPFTLITARELEEGVWSPARPSLTRRSLEYVRELERRQRYALCIWPPHCLIGSIGHGILPPLLEALHAWEGSLFRTVDYVTKGSNPFTEHYSAVQAEVPDPGDPSTQLNTRFIRMLEEADMVLWAGQAGTHCVPSTMRDVFDNFSDPRTVEKMVLLEDAIDPVPGFEHLQEEFIRAGKARGMKTATTRDVVA